MEKEELANASSIEVKTEKASSPGSIDNEVSNKNSCAHSISEPYPPLEPPFNIENAQNQLYDINQNNQAVNFIFAEREKRIKRYLRYLRYLVLIKLVVGLIYLLRVYYLLPLLLVDSLNYFFGRQLNDCCSICCLLYSSIEYMIRIIWFVIFTSSYGHGTRTILGVDLIFQIILLYILLLLQGIFIGIQFMLLNSISRLNFGRLIAINTFLSMKHPKAISNLNNNT